MFAEAKQKRRRYEQPQTLEQWKCGALQHDEDYREARSPRQDVDVEAELDALQHLLGKTRGVLATGDFGPFTEMITEAFKERGIDYSWVNLAAEEIKRHRGRP